MVVGFEYVPGAGDDDELWGRGLTSGMFHRSRERILGMDREEVVGGVEELVRRSKGGLENGLSDLSLQDGDFTPDQTTPDTQAKTDPAPESESPLIGVPHPTSLLALDLGAPVTTTPAWQHISTSRSALVIWVVEVLKSAAYPEVVYPLAKAAETVREAVLALPSAKIDSTGYAIALAKLVEAVRAWRSEGQSIILRPGSPAHLEAAVASQSSSLPPSPNSSRQLSAFTTITTSLSPQELVSARKAILPISLLLICSFPDLMEPTEHQWTTDEIQSTRLSKALIANVLLELVALWPDGNPPRVALRRVNEYLMSPPRGRLSTG